MEVDEYPCAACNLAVLDSDEALQCDGCNCWQHVVCSPGISSQFYQDIVSGRQELLDWRCVRCPLPSFSLLSEVTANESTTQGIERVSFLTPEEHAEDTILDPVPSEVTVEESTAVTYNTVEHGSQKGKKRLVESTGFAYVLKQRTQNAVYWRCSVRNKKVVCPATVVEKGGCFTRGPKDHLHAPIPGLLTASVVSVEVKQQATNNVFKSAPLIVDEVIATELSAEEPCPALSKPRNLARSANRARQKLRPAEPTDLNFELVEDYFPEGFFLQEVKADDQRHLIFATQNQLRLLGQSKTWYLDATFKVVKEPFTQLFSLHCFVRSGSDMKQIPLVFCFMSRRRKKDYKMIFRAIKSQLEQTTLPLKSAVVDFEAGIWQGFRKVFVDVQIRGCSFHWSQAVYRKAQSLGLETAYRRQDASYKLIRKTLSLPYLPAEQIPTMFEALRESCIGSPVLVQLMDYIHSTWMESSVWPIRSWSVYGQSVRTNNDVEGWHRRLNHRAGRGNMHFYILVGLLFEEAKLINLQVRLVSEGKLKRSQHKKTRETHSQIHRLWQEYEESLISPSQLLRQISQLKAL